VIEEKWKKLSPPPLNRARGVPKSEAVLEEKFAVA